MTAQEQKQILKEFVKQVNNPPETYMMWMGAKALEDFNKALKNEFDLDEEL